ncbi:rCG30324 [Rattus norvegicus]|uniref:RCG30324 n=1 Tax=Rattus norvegicus TaxID=10116 RepID=A6IM37_RAT|nr:rCG30324 [Rattus norvegicus]
MKPEKESRITFDILHRTTQCGYKTTLA